MKSLRALSAGALCLATSISHAATLHTFGAGNIMSESYPNDNFFYHHAEYLHFTHGKFNPTMQVSNNGVVVFVDETSTKANTWSLETNQYQYGFGQVNVMTSMDITIDGSSFATFGKRYDLDKDTNEFKPSVWAASSLMTSDGSTIAGAHAGAGTTKGNHIANYPYYVEIRELEVSFEDPGNSAYHTRHSQGHRPAVETFLRAPYEELLFIDADGTAETFLAVQNATSHREEEQSPFLFFSGQRDITLVDKRGRFKLAPYNVIYPVSLSHNGESALAFDYLPDGCASVNAVNPNECAVLIHNNNTITPLGNFAPRAMSGDASIVLGRANGTGAPHHSTEPFPIMWDATNGPRSFISAMNEEGVDLSQWTDVFPLDISQDGSKIVGTGLNPQGIREGFMIDRTSHEANLWQSVESEDATLTQFDSWSVSTIDNDTDQSMKTSSTRAAKLSYKFTGDTVKVYGSRGLNNGYLNVYIDNVFWGSIDTFTCSQNYSDLLFESGYLGEGEHTIILEVAGRQNLSSLGGEIGIDKLVTKNFTTRIEPTISTDVPAANFTVFDRTYNAGGDPAYLLAPGELDCETMVWGCTKQWHRWHDYLFAAQTVSTPLDEAMSEDGSFATEVWFRNTTGPILSLSGMGKVFAVSVDNPYISGSQFENNLYWTGKEANAAATPLDYRYSETAIREFYPVGAQDRAKGQISWNHVVVSGNWLSGQIKIYLNGELVGESSAQADAQGDHNRIYAARTPYWMDSMPYRMRGEIGKFSAYSHELSSSHIQQLNEHPTQYALSFAPNTSSEYSTRLPGCSTGCEAGLDGSRLPIFSGEGFSPGVGLF